MKTIERSDHAARARTSAPLALLGGAPTFERPVYVTRSSAPDPQQFLDHAQRIFVSRWFTNDGALARELETKLQKQLDVGLCALFCNGTVALQAALRALDLRGEVITTPFTFPATTHAIEWNGLKPVFADIDPETYNLDPASVRAAITERTSAVMPVHVFGNPCDVAGFDALAREHDLRIVYDAAHTFGVKLDGRSIGSFGDLSIFSFHATKLFHTAEGGAITAATRELASRVASLRNFGIVSEEEVDGVGLNGKMSELHAAVGLGLLDTIHLEIQARRALCEHYLERLAEVGGVRFQRFSPLVRRNYAYFSIEIEPEAFGLTRDEVHRALRAENIISRKYFFPLCSENPSYRALPSASPERLPHAHRLASRILCLPLFGEMLTSHVDRIVDALLRIREAGPEVRRALQERPA